MKTFVRCTVAILFVLGLSIQVNAQSNSTEKEGRFKVLTLEQVNALTADQINYLTENDIAVRVESTGKIISGEELANQAERSFSAAAKDFVTEDANETDAVPSLDISSTGNEQEDIAVKQELMNKRNEAIMNAPDPADRKPESNEGVSNSKGPKHIEGMSSDEMYLHNKKSENYLIDNKNK